MKIHPSMIDKQLRLPGFFASLLLRPTLNSFQRADKLMQRSNGAGIKGLDNAERWIPARDGHQIRVRIHQPLDRKEALPGVLLLHGGGYVINTPETEMASIKNLITTRACVVVAPDYRLSGEAPYPAALHDCYDTLVWMRDNHEQLGIRPDQLIVYGNSAGGGLTAAVCLLARDQGEVNIAFQIPLYPMIDDRMATNSMIDNNAPVWNAAHNRLAWDLYLRDVDKATVPIYAAPARAKDLSNLPPAFTFVGDLDPFRDETIAYMEKLRDAGVPVEYRVFAGCYHGFDVVNPMAKVSVEARTYLLEKFAYGVAHYFAEQD
ncbi:MAG: alpha/beta hydrolase [Anaerolineae bacterium]|jgi:acetyl esterase/lipase|nr:alpha/beta hydrolase [Anaerolineae bacterium]